MQSYSEEFIKRFEMAQEWISELEGKSTKTEKSRWRKMSLRYLWGTIECTNIHIMGIQRLRVRKSVLNIHWKVDDGIEAPILWPPDRKNWLIGKYPDPGKSGRQEKGMTEDEMAGWHHWLDGHEFEQAPGVGDGQGSLACCCLWGSKELDTTEQLMGPETMIIVF